LISGKAPVAAGMPALYAEIPATSRHWRIALACTKTFA
jgi:hypothetical protein